MDFIIPALGCFIGHPMIAGCSANRHTDHRCLNEQFMVGIEGLLVEKIIRLSPADRNDAGFARGVVNGGADRI